VEVLKSKSGKWARYGNASAQIVVCGHSHVVSILEAAMIRESQVETEPTISICYSDNFAGAPPGDKEYWNFVAELSRGKHVVVAWNGNQHNADFMFQTEPEFTVLSMKDDTYDHELFPIPRLMIKKYFKPSFDELTEIIPLLSGAESINLMNGPAPKPLSYIQNYILQEKYFSDVAKSLGVDISDLVITSDSLRLELWNVLAGLLANSAKDLGANFLSAPAVSLDANGMLLSEYWYPDVTHANSKYGMLLMEELGKLKGKVPN